MSRIKSSDIQIGESFVIGKKETKLDKVDVTDQNFLNSLSDEVAMGIKKIIAQARAEAVDLIKNAQDEIEQMKKQALIEGNEKGYQEGFERGYQDGYDKINSELMEKAARFEEFINLVLEAKNNIYQSAQSELLDFVVRIAEKLCCNQVAYDKDTILNVIMQASTELKEKETLKIIVHPALAQNIYSITDDLKNKIHNLKNIKIIEDKLLKEDGLVLEAADSRIDASFSTRVMQIINELKKEADKTPIIRDDLEIME